MVRKPFFFAFFFTFP
ncbi:MULTISPECIES: pheA operon leader peptide PheL [Serratia]|uniref:PheA operon leader peptide PheL n=1 Tax=Serratia liquefaciens TaxID=614 RepID=A0ABX7DD39_SERLI|nr:MULTISPECIES: pheA operon leader peptide PheL [Serratia]MCI1900980.1 pheA operon leader peptide PheL [Enterobacter sp.]MBF8106684.1 pheA operon leader peptide PheL [Serratia liquefaciens]MBH2812081.1 pheA operon leader peptide PheL [Serratia liquefaciens]MBI6164644.1 pheA operon leader peptide PheL [Serratia liquefaciens]MBV0843281.1 pheA operon leader peptide PheL [Serratia liquefaciens]